MRLVLHGLNNIETELPFRATITASGGFNCIYCLQYRRRNLRFLRGSCTEIPCEDDSIDLIASFETIENINEHDRFLSEIKRVLTPSGILVISSPHKTEHRKASGSANPFHQAELTHAEFVLLIRKTLKHSVVGRQRLVVGSWIAPDGLSPKVSAATFAEDFKAS